MTTEHNSRKHRRKSIRIKGYDYSQAGAYFITICTHNRECLFGEAANGEMRLTRLGEIVKTSFTDLPHRYQEIELDYFTVMPNHIHVIIAITNVGAIHELPLPPNDPMHRRRMLIPEIIGYVKMNTAKRINQSRNTPGARVWQRNYYEHIIRNDDELNQMREYISQNPLQWELDEENPRNR